MESTRLTLTGLSRGRKRSAQGVKGIILFTPKRRGRGKVGRYKKVQFPLCIEEEKWNLNGTWSMYLGPLSIEAAGTTDPSWSMVK
jgi:hypothetical protein